MGNEQMAGPTMIYCRGCRYPLMLASKAGCCPECGQPYDPANSATFSKTPDRFLWRMLKPLKWCVLALAIAVLAILGLSEWRGAALNRRVHVLESHGLKVNVEFRSRAGRVLTWIPLPIRRFFKRQALAWRDVVFVGGDLDFHNRHLLADPSLFADAKVSLNDANDSDAQHISKFRIRSLCLKKATLTGEGIGKIAASQTDIIEIYPTSVSVIGKIGLDPRVQAKSLTMFLLNDMKLSDTAMAGIAKLPRLESLILHGCKLSDQGLLELRASRTLRWLNLAGTKGFSLPAVAELERLLPNIQVYSYSRPDNVSDDSPASDPRKE